MKNFLGLAAIIGFLTFMGIQIFLDIKFEKNCGDYLERASNANSIEMAESQLDIALNYIERNNLTSGYTSILYNTPDEDLGYWYKNINEANLELKALPATTSPLERSNMLIKLRESLIKHDDRGESLVLPSGISKYPNNGILATLSWIFFIGAFIACAYFRFRDDSIDQERMQRFHKMHKNFK